MRKLTDSHMNEPHTPVEREVLRVAQVAPRLVRRLVQRRVDTRRWSRWARARSERPVDELWLAALNRRHEMDHYSPTAAGLRPCRTDCVVCATPIGWETA